MPDAGTATFEIEGMDKLERVLREFPEETNAQMRVAMQGGGEIVRGAVAVYPPASAANSPPGIDGYRWYERGFGTRTRTGRAYPTSQALGRSWNVEVKGTGTTIKGIVGTPVTYARWAQDRERQVWFHKQRGWRTIQDALDQKRDELQAYFAQAIERAVELIKRRAG